MASRLTPPFAGALDFAVILVVVVFFLAYIGAFYFPPNVGRVEALIILQSLLALNGALIGFAGVIGTLIVTRPLAETGISARTAALAALASAVSFLVSIGVSVYYIAKLGDLAAPLQSLPQFGLLHSLFWLIYGVVLLFSLIFGGFPFSVRSRG